MQTESATVPTFADVAGAADRISFAIVADARDELCRPRQAGGSACGVQV